MFFQLNNLNQLKYNSNTAQNRTVAPENHLHLSENQPLVRQHLQRSSCDIKNFYTK